MAEEKKPKYLSEEEKQLNTVVESYTQSRNYFNQRFNKFREWLALYNQEPTQKSVFRANLFKPLVYPIVSTILPRMVANLPKFRYEPREESDQEVVEQATMLTDYQLDRMDFFKKLKMWVKDVLIFGTGVIKLYWRRDDDEGYNDPDLDVVDIFELYPDPKAATIDGGDFTIHRTIASLPFLKRQKTVGGQPLYINLDKVKETPDVSQTRDIDGGVNKLYLGDNKGSLGSPYLNSLTKQVELLEYWGVYDRNEEEWVITVANRNTVIRAEPSPYKKRPFVKMHIDPMNHKFDGKGIVGPIEHLQLELNDISNQRMDNVNLILNKIWIVLKSANVEEAELVSRPGGIIYEDIPGGVRMADTPDVTASAYQEEALIKQDAQNAVGVSDIIQGQIRSADESVPGQVLNKTATGAVIAVQQTGSRFKYYLQNIEDALIEFGEKLFQYNQQFLGEEKVIRIQAPNNFQRVRKGGIINKIRSLVPGLEPSPLPQYEFKRVRPDALRNVKLDVKVEAGSTQPIEETLKQQKALNLVNVLGQLPVVTPDTYVVLAEEILDAYQVANKNRILETLKVAQQAGPKPSINVSLRGELSDFQSSDLAKLAGATDQSTDPRLAAELGALKRRDELVNKLIEDKGKFNGNGKDTIQPGGAAAGAPGAGQ